MLRRIQPSHLLLILGFVWIQFFLGLGGLGLVGPDEPRYAQVAREMLVTGDYVTPRYFGEPWLEKPVLYFWLASAAYWLFGISEFGARLPSALAAVLGVFCVYYVGRQREGPTEGLLSCLVLAASILYFPLARAASTDMLFSAAMAAAWAGLYFLLFGGKGLWRDSAASGSQLGLLLVIYAFLGLATLAKGPAGFLLPLLSLAVFLGLTGRLDLAARFRPITGALVLLAVVLPWYGLCTLANGWGFVEEFLIRHNLERFFTGRYEHPQPFWFFPAVAFIGFFPWSLQLLPSARGLFRHGDRWRSLAGAQDLFLWLWLLTPLVFFSLSRSKLPGYLLPAAPAIALLIGHQVRLWLKPGPEGSRQVWFKDLFFYQGLILLLTGLALPFYATRLNLPVQWLAECCLRAPGRHGFACLAVLLAPAANGVGGLLSGGGCLGDGSGDRGRVPAGGLLPVVPAIGGLPSGGGIRGSTAVRLRNLAQCGLWAGLLLEQPCPDRLFGRRRALSERERSLLCDLARVPARGLLRSQPGRRKEENSSPAAFSGSVTGRNEGCRNDAGAGDRAGAGSRSRKGLDGHRLSVPTVPRAALKRSSLGPSVSRGREGFLRDFGE